MDERKTQDAGRQDDQWKVPWVRGTKEKRDGEREKEGWERE